MPDFKGRFNVVPSLPKKLELLREIANNLYWSWNHDAIQLFRRLDSQLWEHTGHNPMAMLGLISQERLEEVVNREQINHPAAILNRLREKIKYLLNQTGKYDEAKDGMDVALITIDTKDNTLEFAGAYNPLFIYRDKKLEVIKGDRMPIGIHAKEHDFTNHTMQLQKDDRLYLFSDGYPDQMGGSKSRKFMMFRFKEMIIDNAEKDMSEQRQIYLNTIQEWMNHESEEFGDHHDQIDDILLIGMKI